VTARIVEPALLVSKSVSEVEPAASIDTDGNASGVDLDAVITFEVTITNSGADAFDLRLDDLLPEEFSPEGVVSVNPSSGYEAGFDGQLLEVTSTDSKARFTAADELTVIYQARIIDENALSVSVPAPG